ncbi:UNVERIFIED_CONTAM: hypothetical protein PYX00_001632 [Menopon gallinae]|uniref:Vitellogenin n=1 Tax=Menopon gallinae TaxID=328185 RepID=A0AAW2IF46_9NEOP
MGTTIFGANCTRSPRVAVDEFGKSPPNGHLPRERLPTMKELTVLIAVAVLTVRVSGGSVPAKEERVNASSVVKDETMPGTPWLPFFGLNPFQSFTLPGLGLAPQKPSVVPGKIKATKTEYIEVTRRQTVHPVCYTMYENKAPCLPYRSNDEEEPDMDMDVQHQITYSDDVRKEEHPVSEMANYMKPVKEVLDGERNGKYLQFGKRKVKEPEIEGSEGHPRQSAEYVSTTTVLLTKLEKYTDHRVTATMIAQNCLPVDPAIPRCRRYVVNPIIEVPLHGSLKGNKNSIIITPVVKLKSELQDEEIDKTVEAVKKAAEAVRAQTEEQQSTEVPDPVTAAA